MQVKGLSAWYTLLLVGLGPLVGASSDGCGSQNNNNARDDDDDDDSDSSTSHHTHSTSTTSSRSSSSSSCLPTGTSSSLPLPDVVHDGVSKGAVAGIVIGVVLGMVALSAFGLFLWTRYRKSRRHTGDAIAISTVPGQSPHDDSEVRLLADTRPSIPTPGASPAVPLTLPLYAPATSARDIAHAPRAMTTATTTTRNLARSASVSSLPNPYDTEYDAAGSLPLSRAHASAAERDLPPLPDSSTLSTSRPLSETSSSYFTDLSRGQTYTSHHTTATTATRMSLHDEMAQYQKRLEVHHEKEMNSAQAGEGSGVLADPPPEYREQ
ncbi:hypothetical protein EIP86_004902 [Pleurotus ostreatoroseus]|nr:hypothetical protein EIP86_004902 [Pleurotus ostreatoroseus]